MISKTASPPARQQSSRSQQRALGEARLFSTKMAERVVQLGGVAEGTARCAAERSILSKYPMSIATGEEHVEALSSALARFGASCRNDIDQAEELGDADTADILTEISRGIDKWLWFVEAHQQGENGHR